MAAPKLQPSRLFTKETAALMAAPLTRSNVKTRKGSGNKQLMYLPGYYVMQKANEIFGFGNWSTQIIEMNLLDTHYYEKPGYKPGDDPVQMISVNYMCHMQVTVKSPANDSEVHYQDVGFGNGIARNDGVGIASVYELATKEAVTDAFKRCMRYMGDQFGLSLYDTDDIPMTEEEALNAAIVTPDQLVELRAMYTDRDIDDAWVMAALKAESYQGDDLEDMTMDWYRFAFETVRKYKADDVAKSTFKEDHEKSVKLMRESVGMGMLKGLYAEAYRRCQKFDDKVKMKELVDLYEELKAGFENPTEDKTSE